VSAGQYYKLPVCRCAERNEGLVIDCICSKLSCYDAYTAQFIISIVGRTKERIDRYSFRSRRMDQFSPTIHSLSRAFYLGGGSFTTDQRTRTFYREISVPNRAGTLIHQMYGYADL
jgi:hypothetical protein